MIPGPGYDGPREGDLLAELGCSARLLRRRLRIVPMKALLLVLVLGLGVLAAFPFLRGFPPADPPPNPEVTESESSQYGQRTREETADAGQRPSDNLAGGAPAVKRKRVGRPMMFPDDPVADVVFGVIRDVVSGSATEEHRQDLEDRIAGILEEEGMGKPEGRIDAARLTIDTMLKRSKGQQLSAAPINPRQIEAMRIAASEVAIDLYRRLPMTTSGFGGHEGAALAKAVEVAMPPGYEALKWETIGTFQYHEGMVLPDPVLALNQKKMGIAGYMMTLEEVEDIRQFLLVESIWACCFGMPPEVNQVILVTIPKSLRGVDYTLRPVLCAGTFDVGEVVEDGFVTSLYRMEVSEFKEIE